MFNRLVQILVGILVLVHMAPAMACSVPPPRLTLHHAELVANTENIVLARVTGGGESANFGWVGKRQIAEFEVVETLKGDVEDGFSLENGFLGFDGERERNAGDFRGHKDAMFWDKHITRQWNMPDCTMQPVFFEGQTYLIFVDHPHWRAYEEIRSNDDLWLEAVHRLIDDSSLASGVSMDLKEWLSLSRSVFIGKIEECDGSALAVTEALHGPTDQPWRYSDDEMYFPKSRCGIGREYLVVTYAPEPLVLPHYSSSMFPIRNGQIDISDALEDSEIEIRAESTQKVESLRKLFSPTDTP